MEGASIKRVMIINTSFPPAVLGGAELSVAELASDLSAKGIEVIVVCLAPPGAMEAAERYALGVRVIRIPTRGFNLSGKPRRAMDKVFWHLLELSRVHQWRALRRQLREAEPDVVHLNNLAGFGWLAWLAVRRYPSVQTVRDYSLVCTSATGEHDGQKCDRRLWRCRILKSPFTVSALRPGVAVGVSEHVARRMESARIVGRREPNRRVYNVPRVETAGDRREPTSLHCLGFLGRPDPDKGVDVLLQALRRLRAGGVPIRLLIGGETTAAAAANLRRTYQHEIAEGHVDFLGRVNPSEFLRRVDAVAVPTQWEEPFGRTAAEALLLGVPLVHSGLGGLSELVPLFGGHAIVVRAFRSPDAWAQGIRRAVSGDWDQSDAGVSSPPPVVDAYLELYREVMNR